MKYMLHMNVPKGDYQMQDWSQDDVKKMVGFMHQLNKDLKDAGQLVTAEGLVSPTEARLVRADDGGNPIVTDGPFSESKEFIAGFWIVEVNNADEAYRIAARASSSPGPGGKPMNMPIEVRAIGAPPA